MVKLPTSKELLATALIAVVSGGAYSGILLSGQVADEAAESSDAPTERPRRIRSDEREILKEENRQVEELGRQIDILRERALDAGNENISFEELKSQAIQNLSSYSASFSPPAPMDEVRAPQEHNSAMAAPQRVCFRADGSVTALREECDGDQSRHFGMEATSVTSDMQGGYDIPSYGDVTGYMNQHFTPPEPPSFPRPPSLPTPPSFPASPVSRGADPAHTMGFTPAPQMGMILAMMETVMNEKLPQVFALFEGAGLALSPEATTAYQRAQTLFNQLKGPCGTGDVQSCFRMSDVADLMMGMRPTMEKAIMESGNWAVGMKIGQIMEGAGPPPGMHGGPPPGMPMQRGNYGGQYGEYGNYGNYGGY